MCLFFNVYFYGFVYFQKYDVLTNVRIVVHYIKYQFCTWDCDCNNIANIFINVYYDFLLIKLKLQSFTLFFVTLQRKLNIMVTSYHIDAATFVSAVVQGKTTRQNDIISAAISLSDTLHW